MIVRSLARLAAVCAIGCGSPTAAPPAPPVYVPPPQPEPARAPAALAVEPRARALRGGDALKCHRSEVGREGNWVNLCVASFVGETVKAELEKLDNKKEV